MERTISTEERIRRAEEIYAKRRQGVTRPIAMVNVNNDEKKDIKLLKKMIIQILICVAIYLIIYAIQNNEYVFSKDFTNKLNEVLSYDTNFTEIYNNVKSKVQGIIPNNETNQNQDQTQEEQNNNEGQESSNADVNGEVAIGGSDEAAQNAEASEEKRELTPEEQEIATIKSTANFIKPVEGTISSGFGQRESTNENIPKNHTGTDIAANLGTKIKSATDGEVVLVSEEGAYGKHIKVQIGEVSIIYAHCNAIYVKQGDKITQGQEIAEVGTTGKSTGPDLHFEIMRGTTYINPRDILEF